jgi:hypothetical protein
MTPTVPLLPGSTHRDPGRRSVGAHAGDGGPPPRLPRSGSQPGRAGCPGRGRGRLRRGGVLRRRRGRSRRFAARVDVVTFEFENVPVERSPRRPGSPFRCGRPGVCCIRRNSASARRRTCAPPGCPLPTSCPSTTRRRSRGGRGARPAMCLEDGGLRLRRQGSACAAEPRGRAGRVRGDRRGACDPRGLRALHARALGARRPRHRRLDRDVPRSSRTCTAAASSSAPTRRPRT